MIKWIALITLYSFICCPAFGSSFSSGYVITQNKNNPSVSLYQTEDVHSKILQKIPNGIPMSCSDDMSENIAFCFVKFDGDDDLNWGCIDKINLSFLDQDKSFSKIPLIKSSLYSAIYSNSHMTVSIKLIEKKINKKDLYWRATHDGTKILMYRGKKFYGSDEPISGSAYT